MSKARTNGHQASSQKKTVINIVLIFCAMAMAAGLFSWLFERYVMKQAEENITNLLFSHKGIHHYVQEVLLPAYAEYQDKGDIDPAFYAPELLSSSFIVRNQHVFYNQELKAAGMHELYYKMAARNPRNPVNMADSLEMQLIELFNHNRDLTSYQDITEINGHKMLYVAIPFLENSPNCMRCHGKREDAPVELQQRYPGEGGFNEELGEIRAITSIRAPLEHEYSNIYAGAAAIFTGFFMLGGLSIFSGRLRKQVRRKTASLEQEVQTRKRSELMLQQNRGMLRQILDTAPQSIFWRDRRGVYLGCNMEFARTVGLSDPDEIIGRTDHDLPWSAEDREAYMTDDRDVMDNYRAKEHIIEPLVQANGEKRWIDTSKLPLLDAGGSVYGVLGVFEDITEKKRAEEEKVELQKQLQQAQKMEAIGTLAGGIAHDFNNILAGLYGFSDMALKNLDKDSDVYRIVKQMQKGNERAAGLVRQLLAFSRKQTILPKELALNSMLDELSNLLHQLIGAEIQIEMDLCDDDPVIRADTSQFEQIIINLFVNARDAIKERHEENSPGMILLQTRLVDAVDLDKEDLVEPDVIDAVQYVRISVCDNGCGICKEDMDRIFEPFFTTKSVGKGSGLGLATIYGIVKQNRGHVHVESEAGRGSTFHIYWPRNDKAQAGELAAVKKSERITGNEAILYVEDEEMVRAASVSRLKDEGYVVIEAANGEEALDIILHDGEHIDLLITDMSMPKMNGSRLVTKVLELRPDMKVIVCSGYNEDMHFLKNLRPDPIKFLEKPFTADELLHSVRAEIDKK